MGKGGATTTVRNEPAAAAAGAPAADPVRDETRAAQVDVVLRHLASLPTLSPIATRLMALSSAADADFDEIVKLIEADPSLTARLLSLCRRASLGVSQQVTTVKRAAVMLGVEAVQAAVLSVEIYEVLSQASASDERRGEASGGFDRAGFWRHCLAVGAAAELLAESSRGLKIRPEEAFTAGLVHDLGKLVLDWSLPKTYARVAAIAEARSMEVARVERAVIGLDHHAAGKRLSEHWSLPTLLHDAMWLHGQPAAALPDVRHKPLILLITLADAIARAMHLGWTGSCHAPADPLGMAAEAGVDRATVEDVMARLPDAVSRRSRDLGLGDEPQPRVVLGAMSAANRRLSQLHEACRREAEDARRSRKVLAALAEFAGSFTASARVAEVVEGVLKNLGTVAGEGFSVAVYQPREGEPWRLGVYHPELPFQYVGPFEAPEGERGAAVDLLEVCKAGSLGGAVGLVNWLSENLPAAATASPDLRRLRVTPLPSPSGPATVLVHERDLAGACGNEATLRSLCAQWSCAIGAAAQAEGSRRLAEALNQTSRVLTETQAKLTESQSLVRLGELASGAAHEMNNPLTVISGRSQLLAARLASPRDRADAEQIVAAAGRLTGLISSMHLLARPPEFRPGPVALADLMQGVIKSVREAKGPGAGPDAAPTLKMVVPEQVGLIRADRALLTRALGELVRNAIESGPRGVLELRGGVDPLDGRLVLTVRDDGAGMSAHALAHAFDPFFSEKPAGRQCGMGLPIARRLAMLHGGEITLESVPGKGTTATLSLSNWKWAAQTSKAA